MSFFLLFIEKCVSSCIIFYSLQNFLFFKQDTITFRKIMEGVP